MTNPLIHWPATRLGVATSPAAYDITLAEETPLSLRYNTMQYAVMMVTPQDIEDFCIGFSLTEGIVPHADAVKGVTLMTEGSGLIADLRIAADPFHRLMQTSRRMVVGRTGCGVCGTETEAQIIRPLPSLPAGAPCSLAAIRRGLAGLAAHQILNSQVRMVHGAAWCGPKGDILLVREDVGRHNALDKLIGAQLRKGQNFAEGFCLLTSRCSYEMVQKAIIAGMRTLVAISAPTGLALEVAKKAGLTLLAIARPDAQILFTGTLAE